MLLTADDSRVQDPTSFKTSLDDLEGITSTAVAHIRKNLSKRVTLKDLGEITGRNPFQIIRAFHRDLGTTPHAFVIAERVERALAMLMQGESAAEVASEVGFVDQSHFTRHFKRRFGTTPKRFVSDNRLSA